MKSHLIPPHKYMDAELVDLLRQSVGEILELA